MTFKLVWCHWWFLNCKFDWVFFWLISALVTHIVPKWQACMEINFSQATSKINTADWETDSHANVTNKHTRFIKIGAQSKRSFADERHSLVEIFISGAAAAARGVMRNYTQNPIWKFLRDETRHVAAFLSSRRYALFSLRLPSGTQEKNLCVRLLDIIITTWCMCMCFFFGLELPHMTAASVYICMINDDTIGLSSALRFPTALMCIWGRRNATLLGDTARSLRE